MLYIKYKDSNYISNIQKNNFLFYLKYDMIVTWRCSMRRKISIFLILNLLFSQNLKADDVNVLDPQNVNKLEKNIKIESNNSDLSKIDTLKSTKQDNTENLNKLEKDKNQDNSNKKENNKLNLSNVNALNFIKKKKILIPTLGLATVTALAFGAKLYFKPSGGGGGNPGGGPGNPGSPGGSPGNPGSPGGSPGNPGDNPQDLDKNKLENLIPGVTDFLKDDSSIRSYINDILPSVTEILKNQNAVADLVPAPGKKVMIIGDIHGDEKTLKWVIKNSYEHLKDGGSVVFLGDLVDHRFRGPDKSIHAILWALNLVKLFPNQVIVLHGNHEDIKGGFCGSIESYQNKNDVNDKLNNCISALPMACEIKSNGRKFFCSHGYIPLLDDYTNFKNKVKKRNLCDSSTWNSDGSIEYGLMWNDPIGPTNRASGVTEDSDTNQSCGSKYIKEEISKKFFKETGYKAIFRGHDPQEQDIDIKIGDNHIITIHALSWFVDRSSYKVGENSPRNARFGLISENYIETKYPLEDEKGPDLTIEI